MTVSDERIPWSQQLIETKVAKAISESLLKSEQERKKASRESTPASGTGFTTRRIDPPTSRKPRPAKPGAEQARTDRKSALIFLHTPGKAVWFDIDGTRYYGKILRDAPEQDGVYVATKESEAFVRTGDLHELTDAMMERVREQQDKARDEDLEQQGVRLSRFGMDDVRPGMPLQVEGMYGTSQRGRVVYVDPEKGHFLVLRVFGTNDPPVFVAARPDQIQIVPDERGELPCL